jgi:hypothetical protein
MFSVYELEQYIFQGKETSSIILAFSSTLVPNLWFTNPFASQNLPGGSRKNISNGVFLFSQIYKVISNLVSFATARFRKRYFNSLFDP